MTADLPGIADIRKAQARLASLLPITPLVRSDWLSAMTGAEVFLKLESLQPTRAFKIRGAFNALLALAEKVGSERPTIVTASAGNHGRAVAHAAASLGFPTVVFTPATAPETKKNAIRRSGAELRDDSADYDEAEHKSREYANRIHATYVSSYNDHDVIAGAGTAALEIAAQCPSLDVLVGPLGGGGLLSGLLIAVRGLHLNTQVVGVECEASTAFSVSLARGAITEITPQPSIADGLTGNLETGSITFELVRRHVDRVVSVGEAELKSAIRLLAEHDHIIAEGAGAAATAGVMARPLLAKGQRAVVMLSGANIDLETLTSAVAMGESPRGLADFVRGVTVSPE